jgi:ABC-type transport system involved in cytochrome bd biosynthesis fused ATPase/permease subunit
VGHAGPRLVLDVSVQASRFHVDATAPLQLRGICVSVGGEPDDSGSDSDGAVSSEDERAGSSNITARRDLLVDADLSLTSGTRYALVGRNGSGKSVFLKVLASGALFDPDVQLALRVQLVSQSFEPPPS